MNGSKNSRSCVFLHFVLIIVDSDLAPCFNFRTLAERVEKKAKVPVVEVADDSPIAATGDVPEPSLPDPSAAPRGSPQRSPQRKSGFCTSARRACLRNRPCANILIFLSCFGCLVQRWSHNRRSVRRSLLRSRRPRRPCQGRTPRQGRASRQGRVLRQ